MAENAPCPDCEGSGEQRYTQGLDAVVSMFLGTSAAVPESAIKTRPCPTCKSEQPSTRQEDSGS